MMGFAWGTGGMTVPLTGFVADRIGIESTLLALSLVPLIARRLRAAAPQIDTASADPEAPLPAGPSDPPSVVR